MKRSLKWQTSSMSLTYLPGENYSYDLHDNGTRTVYICWSWLTKRIDTFHFILAPSQPSFKCIIWMAATSFLMLLKNFMIVCLTIYLIFMLKTPCKFLFCNFQSLHLNRQSQLCWQTMYDPLKQKWICQYFCICVWWICDKTISFMLNTRIYMQQ